MIRLHRTITIESFEVEGTIARSHDRPELLAVAQLAADAPGGLTPAVLAHELFGGQATLCKAVIDRCVKIGLLDRRHPNAPAMLSARGREMLASGQVRVPEDRTWRIYYVDDPLLEAAIVHVEPCWDGNARDTRNQFYGGRKQGAQPEPPQSCPAALREAVNEQAWSSIVDRSSFELMRLSSRGLASERSPVRLELDFVLDEPSPRLCLHGELAAPRQPPKQPALHLQVRSQLAAPNVLMAWTYDQMWRALVAHASKVEPHTLDHACEQARRRVLPQRWDDTNETERRSMRRTVAVAATRIAALGQFEPTQIDDVELIARAPEDARKWAAWLQWDGINDYCTPASLRANGERVIARFPDFDLQAGPPEGLLAYATRNPGDPAARYLLTSSDLGLWS